MFVQALAEYADNHLQRELDDVAFEEQANSPTSCRSGMTAAFSALPRVSTT